MDKGAFILNCYHVKKNGLAGAHDPSMMWDPVSRTYYSYATDVFGEELGLTQPIGIPIRSSKDLVHFQFEGYALSREAIEEGRDNGEYPKTFNFWAPFVEYVKGEYRMYYSATKAFGSSESRIWLAVSKSPLGPFENRGVICDTWGTDDSYPNAIDPHIQWDQERCYLIYGSYFGGIYCKELSPDTGLSKSGDTREMGHCISKKGNPAVIDGPEGASMLYVKETGYFYLFQSYGWLGDDYDIRVGRSRSVMGPFLDWKGQNLVEEGLGLKLANSYEFRATAPFAGTDDKDWCFGGFRGPGHGVPFYDPTREKYFFVHHIRDGAVCNRYEDKKTGLVSYRKHYMMIRPMFFVEDWPVFGPEPFSGESLDLISVCAEDTKWEVIYLDNLDNTPKKSVIIDDKALKGNGSQYVCYMCHDYENNCKTIAATGISKEGVCFWAKKQSR